jgi:hypothetical protein
MQLVGFHRDTIDRVSGISAVARGTQLRRREPAAAVDAVQEASFVRVRAVIRNLEEALRRVGNLTASNMVQFYTDRRCIPVVGPKGAERSMTLAPKHFWVNQYDLEGEPLDDEPLRFQVWVQAGSSQPISRQARAAEADFLYQLGAIDTATLLKSHAFPGADEVGPQMDQQKQQAAMQQLQSKG